TRWPGRIVRPPRGSSSGGASTAAAVSPPTAAGSASSSAQPRASTATTTRAAAAPPITTARRRQMTAFTARNARSSRRDGLRQRLDELLELAGRPALERLAVLLVGGDHGVAVVPVQARLGVQPERAAGALGHRGEHLGARVAAVGAGVAEHDHGGARVQVVLDEHQELAPDAPVV